MEAFKESVLIMFSTPAYAILIGLEIILSYIHNRHYYSVKGTVTNVYLSALNFGLDILLRGVCLLVLDFFFRFHFFEISNPYLYWITLLVFQDLMFYFLHLVDHVCRLFWAVHVTHHSSEEFNLTVGFRSSVFQPVYRFIWFIPLSLAGFKPVDVMFMYSATQIYGILIHTQHVGKLGFLEWFLATPSHHRVHHGSNPEYLDRNMGMVFIIWDRIFGTFEEEKAPVRYGLTENIKTHHPFKVVFHEWQAILNDLRKPAPLKAKIMYIFGPPGWSHDGSKKTSRQMRAELAKEKNVRKRESVAA
jgi:sterol desaturase/sphingolipid hydroxylase (fatty acid hydroxylase superfamily)